MALRNLTDSSNLPSLPTRSSVSRITREGKKITYNLEVTQQPQRARACGAGAKSSADRRPVDPPPVVEMHIYESDPHDDLNRTDITFAYNANFFLFATLESRPVAQGRLASAPSCPVLTGVPVAGVAYLDKPNPAGYFIFPDLSVRHEGFYRLSFHLFEQTKDLKDGNERTQPLPEPAPGKLSAPHQFLDFRLEVNSADFQVYSAKKFPGLTKSTNLSSTIADQGCRVRIRRDVRMRRRGDKHGDEFGNDNERAHNGRHLGRYGTPDAYSMNASERPRSTSISTVDHTYGYPSQRRPSGPEYSVQNPQQYQRPIPLTPVQSSTPVLPGAALAPLLFPPPLLHLHPYTPTLSHQSHISFVSSYPYQTPSMPHGPPSTTTANINNSHRRSISHERNSSTGTAYETSTPVFLSNPHLPAERPSYSKPQPALPPMRLPSTLSMQRGEGQHTHELAGIARSHTPSNMGTSLPSLKSLSDLPPAASQPSSIGSSPGNEYGPVRGLWETPQMTSKRTYDETFGHDDRPLYNGKRPDSTHHGEMHRRLSSDSDSGEFTYKRANGDMNDADHQLQLQRSLELTCRPSNSHDASYSSRKHTWNASRTSLESDYLSEVSGQFDDAEEFGSPLPGHNGVRAAGDANYSPSSHSVKRQRSNDWPRQSTDNISTGRRETASGSARQRWGFHHYGRRSHGSPRSPRHGRSGRRSRFVEGHMNDTVSEKPPSIFFRDEARNETARSGSRQSGIFRFGKAIASAFNPFGGWGTVSEILKGSHDERPQEVTDDPLRRAELAYEELKRSGYQGTAKGSYMQSLKMTDTTLPEETWKSIQSKMDYGSDGGGQHSRQSSGQTPSNPKSSLGFPSLKNRGQEVRHQKSRKDMQRQAKLLKRVSDLEDKLQRARRELLEVSGEEDVLTHSMTEEKPYQRKFIPGALPSLPSERLLHDPELTAPLSPLKESTQTQLETQTQVSKTCLLSPRPWRRSSTPEPHSRSAQSPSRKRKSPGPESRQLDPNNIHQQPLSAVSILEDQPSEPARPTQTPTKPESQPDQGPDTTKPQTKTPPSRKAKLPKTARGDSPGSVERKQKQNRSPAAENSTLPGDDRPSRPLRSMTRNRSAPPVLRMKQGRGDLRSTNPPGHAHGVDLDIDENKENQTEGESEKNIEDHNGESEINQDTQHQNESDQTPTTTTPKRKVRYEYIPPVPPLPKDLAATAAKVDRRLAREMGKRRVQREKDGKGEGFQWPEDIF
ncbi:velvet factor-domain-containing protein [Aspergillus crustosus]